MCSVLCLSLQLDAENLKVQYNFNITLDHTKFGEMFIVCGHLYAIDSCTAKNSQIRYAVDLYQGNLRTVNLPFTNPFSRTTTVGYNPYTVVSSWKWNMNTNNAWLLSYKKCMWLKCKCTYVYWFDILRERMRDRECEREREREREKVN